MAKVKVYKSDYENLDTVVQRILIDFPLEVKNRKVLVKPNILSRHRPETGICTHPSLVKAVVKKFLSLGAEVMVGDNPSILGTNANEMSAQVTGIKEASIGTFVDISKKYKKIRTDFGEVLVSSQVLDCDYLISLPKFKTHSLTLFTGAIKNMFGILVGQEKPRMHYLAQKEEDFSNLLLDIYRIRQPDLTIIDGIIGMEGEGPSSGNLIPISRLYASYSGYALDWIMPITCGIEPLMMGTNRQAKRRGLFSESSLDVEGDFYILKKFKLPISFVRQPQILRLFNRLVYHPFRRKVPKIIRKECTLCGECIKVCPVEAISIISKRLKIERSLCIYCLACSEACPYRALRVK